MLILYVYSWFISLFKKKSPFKKKSFFKKKSPHQNVDISKNRKSSVKEEFIFMMKKLF